MSKLEELIAKLCPNGVEYKKIGDICNICRGVVMSKEFIRDNVGDYPVYSSQTENNGEFGKISTYNFDGEYITWTTDGANAGSVFYRNGKFSVTNVCGVLEIKDKNVSAKFLFYVLQITTKNYVNSGMGNPKLMSNVMARVKIPIPPMEVQEEIVRILDKFTELTAELTARKKQYEFYRDKLFIFDSLVKKLKLSEIADIGTGNSNTNAAEEGGIYPFFVRSQEKKRKNTYEYDEKAIITAGDGVGVGKVFHYIEGKYALHQRAYRIHVNTPGVISKYLFYYMKTTFLSYIQKTVFHGSVSSIRRPMLELFPVPVPPIEEQKRIVEILDRFDQLCNDISEGLPAEIEARKKQYEYYRDKLLAFQEIAH